MRQSLHAARLALAGYVLSGWVLGDVLMVLAVVAVSTGGNDPRSTHPAVAYFFGLHGADFLAVTALGTVLLVRRTVGMRSYVVLSRLTTRAAYVAGVVLASAALRLPQLALLVGLGLATGRMQGADVTTVLAGSAGLLGNAVLAGTVAVGLMPPFSGRRELILAVLFAAAVLAPVSGPPAPAGAVQQVLQLPLWPASVNIRAGALAAITGQEALALSLEAAYVVAIVLIAGRRFEARDLLYT